jgi:hypothetical protein
MSEEFIKLVEIALEYGLRFQIRYYDYDDSSWTAPVMMNESRANSILNDSSVSGIRIEFNEK